jgi:hypothetical protein
VSEPSADVGPAAQDRLLRCRVSAPDRAILRSFIEAHGADVGCRPVAVTTETGVSAYVELTGAQVAAARSTDPGVRTDVIGIEVLEDLTASMAARQAEVGAGDRFAGGARDDGSGASTRPRGVGRKE